MMYLYYYVMRVLVFFLKYHQTFEYLILQLVKIVDKNAGHGKGNYSICTASQAKRSYTIENKGVYIVAFHI